MKIWSTSASKLVLKCITIFQLLLSSMMGAFVWEDVLKHLGGKAFTGTNAKCIHDIVSHPTLVQSSQVYEKHFNKASSVRSTTVQPSSTVEVQYVYHPSYVYYYEYQKRTTVAKPVKQNTPINRRQKRSNEVSSKLSPKRYILKHQSKRQIQGRTDDRTLEYFESLPWTDSEVNALFKPIRLEIWYDFNNIIFANHSEEFSRLREAINKAKEEIQEIFSVIPVKDKLLLSRHNICAFWNAASAVNSGKCAQHNPNYNGETCLDFKIPDEHLKGFATHTHNSTHPSHVHYSNGSGIVSADTVIYIRSKQVSYCFQEGTAAYASYCQLDQFSRPIAGYANFCPKTLQSTSYDPESFYLTVLHEFFHILGFSQKLFDKFQICRKKPSSSQESRSQPEKTVIECEDRKNVVVDDNNWYRIMTPAVMRESTKHFNCTTIGGPLEAAVQDRKISSHWEARYFQSSIMTASLGLPHLTVLDPITLALFEDTGWYKVDFSRATNLTWGHNAGCEFGSEEYCHNGNNPYFCTNNDLVNGCHYLHLDKGVCRASEFLDSCKMYKASKESSCWNPKNEGDPSVMLQTGETYNINSRCFISNISSISSQVDSQNHQKQSPLHRSKRSAGEEGRCYEHRCNNSRTLEIRVRGSQWALCPSLRVIRIPGYNGVIRCPTVRHICDPRLKVQTKSATEKSCASINISFSDFMKWLGSSKNNSLLKLFTQRFQEKIEQTLKETGMSVYKEIRRVAPGTFSFQLTAAVSGGITVSKYKCGEVVRKITELVKSKKFIIKTNQGELMATHIAVKYTLHACEEGDSTSATQQQDYKDPSRGNTPPGIIAAVAVGVICATVFASVGGVLYFKSTIPRSIAPATVSSVQVNYNQNNRSSLTTASDSGGSVGQLEFPV